MAWLSLLTCVPHTTNGVEERLLTYPWVSDAYRFLSIGRLSQERQSQKTRIRSCNTCFQSANPPRSGVRPTSLTCRERAHFGDLASSSIRPVLLAVNPTCCQGARDTGKPTPPRPCTLRTDQSNHRRTVGEPARAIAERASPLVKASGAGGSRTLTGWNLNRLHVVAVVDALGI